MVAHHQLVHAGKRVCTDRVTLSVDGVKESGSTMISLLVYSMRFEGCRLIHCIAVVRPQEKIKVDHLHVLARIIKQLK